MTATAARTQPVREARQPLSLVRGLVLTTAVAAAATGVGTLVPVVGAPVVAVVVGALLSPLVLRRAAFAPGLAVARGPVLQLAVVLLGAQLSLREVATTGLRSLPVLAGTLTVCLVLAAVLGRRMGIGRDLRTLIGVGTGICGASAIAAVSPVIRAKNPDIAYAISTIFLFNVAAVLAFPPLGHALGLSQHAFGLFAGTAVNDTSSVVAAAASYGSAATSYAVVVKLTRTLAIIPICLVLGARRGGGDGERTVLHRAVRLVPWFLVGFVAVAAANSLGWIPTAAHPPVHDVEAFLVTAALAAIGLGTDVGGLCRAGARPLGLGLVLWIAVTGTSLAIGAV